MNVARALGLTAALGFAGGSVCAADETPAADALRGGDVNARLARAVAMRNTDVRALGAALIALGKPDPAATDDASFLVEFIAAEPNRALRLLATESLQRLDAARAASSLLLRAGSEHAKDGARAAACLECVGPIATKEHVPALLEFLSDKRGPVASTAADALARTASKAEVPVLADRGLVHDWIVVADHCGLAALDVLGDRAKSLAAFLPKKDEAVPRPREARIASVAALLQDPDTVPHKWASPFAAARKALFAAPKDVALVPLNPAMDRWFQDGVRWFREHAPADYWVVCASLKSIGWTEGDTKIDLELGKLQLCSADAGLSPDRWACVVLRHATLAWQKTIGEPSTGRRGWEAAIAATYDLAVRASVDGAQAASRERFIDRWLSLRPWKTK